MVVVVVISVVVEVFDKFVVLPTKFSISVCGVGVLIGCESVLTLDLETLVVEVAIVVALASSFVSSVAVSEVLV